MCARVECPRIDLTQGKEDTYFPIVEKIIFEDFSELSNIYKEITIILAYNEHYDVNEIKKKSLNEYLGKRQ